MHLPTSFAASRRKIARARSIKEDLFRLTNPLDRSLYDLSVFPEIQIPNSHPHIYALRYSPRDRISSVVSLPLGDVLNNYRSALDYIASSLVRAKNPKRLAHFPMPESRGDLSGNKHMKWIEEVLPGSTQLMLDHIRTDGAADECYWSFSKINNDDKHNDIIATVAATNAGIGVIRFPNGGSLENCLVNFNADYPYNIVGSDMPFDLPAQYSIVVEVKFGNRSALAGRPVFPALDAIDKLVERTISEFEKHISRPKV